MTQPTVEPAWYLVIEGAIGVGKTTLARMLRDHFSAHLVLEVFEENPFLTKFYESRAQYAFQTQMFFLLSRYRQQQQKIVPLLRTRPLITDYMFAKDQLFARLNLSGDEWDIYQQIHTALTEHIPNPDLIVYLQADTDVLMARIAQRDRPYERNMDRGYIEALRQAYEEYFTAHREVPVLVIDTNSLNFVANAEDFQYILDRLRSALRAGVFQQPLPQFEILSAEGWPVQGRPLADWQRFHGELDRAKGFNANVYFNYLRLGEEVGNLGRELAQLWIEEETMVSQGLSAAEARRLALHRRGQALESELADCLAYLLKLANHTGIDLESACLEKVRRDRERP